jgi:hypothetical protein
MERRNKKELNKWMIGGRGGWIWHSTACFLHKYKQTNTTAGNDEDEFLALCTLVLRLDGRISFYFSLWWWKGGRGDGIGLSYPELSWIDEKCEDEDWEGNVIVVERAPCVLRKITLHTKFQFPVKPSRGGIFCRLNNGEGKKGGKTEV